MKILLDPLSIGLYIQKIMMGPISETPYIITHEVAGAVTVIKLPESREIQLISTFYFIEFKNQYGQHTRETFHEKYPHPRRCIRSFFVIFPESTIKVDCIKMWPVNLN